MTPYVRYVVSACCIVLALTFFIIPASLGGCSRAGECNVPFNRAPFLDCHGFGCCNGERTCLYPESYFGGCKVEKCDLATALEDYGFCSAENCQKCTDPSTCSAFPTSCAWGVPKVSHGEPTARCMQQYPSRQAAYYSEYGRNSYDDTSNTIWQIEMPWCNGLDKESCVDAPITGGCSWGYPPAPLSGHPSASASKPVCKPAYQVTLNQGFSSNTCMGDTEAKCLIGGTENRGISHALSIALSNGAQPDQYSTRCYWVEETGSRECSPTLRHHDCTATEPTGGWTHSSKSQCQDGCIWVTRKDGFFDCESACSHIFHQADNCTPERTGQKCTRVTFDEDRHMCMPYQPAPPPPKPPAPRLSACPAECKARGLPIYAFWLMICLAILLLTVGCAVAVSTFYTGTSSEGLAASDDLASPGPSTEMDNYPKP